MGPHSALWNLFHTILWVMFIVDAILLVLIVLLQSGRGGGLSGMLGGGGMAESALGPKSGLPRITGAMAAIFFGTTILIGIMNRPSTIGGEAAPEAPETKPASSTATPGEAQPAAGQEGKKEGMGKPSDEPKASPSTAATPRPAPSAGPKPATAAPPARSPAPGTSTSSGANP